MFLTVTVRTDEGAAVGVIVLADKVFSSGKPGYFGQAKLAIDGQRYQGQVQLVAIGAKDSGQIAGADQAS